MKQIVDAVLSRNKLNRRLHWTTIASEKVLLAIIGVLTLVASADSIIGMWEARKVEHLTFSCCLFTSRSSG